MHDGEPYDPQKAHDYYLRTRKLKGRTRGAVKPPPKGRTRGHTFNVTSRNGTTEKLTAQQLAAQQAYAAQRVTAIKAKITKLNDLLQKKMAKARLSDAKAKKGPTVADKAKTAKDAKSYRQKHEQELKNKAKVSDSKKAATTKASTDSVAGLQTAISNAKKSLDAVIQRQRELNSATRNG